MSSKLQIDALEIEMHSEYSFGPPNGLLGDIAGIIGDQFEVRHGIEMFRSSSAVWIGNALVGNKIVGPNGLKMQMSLYQIAASGAGKNAIRKVIESIDRALGVKGRIIETTFTSQKQLEIEMINSGGCVNWLLDDKESYVAKWDDPRSGHLCGINDLIRSLSSQVGNYQFAPTIVSQFRGELEEIKSTKNIARAAAADGVMLKDGMPPESHELTKEIRRAEKLYDRAKNGLPNAIINTLFSSTYSKTMMGILTGAGVENGQVGRGWVVLGPAERCDFKDDLQDRSSEMPRGTINLIKSMLSVPEKITCVMSKEAAELSNKLIRKIDSIRSGAIGSIAARQGELLIKIACIVSFYDQECRKDIMNGVVSISERNIYWAFGEVVRSLRGLDTQYSSNAEEPDGTVGTEWIMMLNRLRDVLDKFGVGEEYFAHGKVKDSFFKAKPYADTMPSLIGDECSPKMDRKRAKNAIFDEMMLCTKNILWCEQDAYPGKVFLRYEYDIESIEMSSRMQAYLGAYVSGKSKNRWRK